LAVVSSGIGAEAATAALIGNGLRAALHWFCDLGAITEDEFNDIERIYALRTDIGPELFQVIADDNKNPIKLDDVLTTFSPPQATLDASSVEN
jgi:hypothetical protein